MHKVVKRFLKLTVPIILLNCMMGCQSSNPAAVRGTTGEFSLLTYNIAGLPQGISPSNPETNIPLMSPLLNKYDLALVQEDFFYHDALAAEAQHQHKSTPKANSNAFTAGDGLNRFSNFEFNGFSRKEWSGCSNTTGEDCRARKGFSMAESELAPGVSIDIYNLHMDAGGTAEDISARRAQIQQLLNEIRLHSAGKSVIIAGDTNLDILHRVQDDSLFQALMNEANLTDACQSLSCNQELVDRVLFRSSNRLQLSLISWQVDNDFVDSSGKDLSDHKAIATRFKWEVL